jgi:hypothetical protein
MALKDLEYHLMDVGHIVGKLQKKKATPEESKAIEIFSKAYGRFSQIYSQLKERGPDPQIGLLLFQTADAAYGIYEQLKKTTKFKGSYLSRFKDLIRAAWKRSGYIGKASTELASEISKSWNTYNSYIRKFKG